VAHVDVPVLAAGGIVDRRGFAAALRWGAQDVVVSTGFLATRESFAHDYHKRRLVEAKVGETIHRSLSRQLAKRRCGAGTSQQRHAQRTRRSVSRWPTGYWRRGSTAYISVQHGLAFA